MTADQIRSLQPELAALLEMFRSFFVREATFEHCQRYVLGLMADLKRKSIEPIALAAGVPVRTLQEFLAFFKWDHARAGDQLQRLVVDRHRGGNGRGILVFDSSGHAKQGDKTPGVQRQWCGETGKVDNCIVGQHLLYTDNDVKNPFTCMLASDLFLSESWARDRKRCRKAGIPDQVIHRPKWQMAIDQAREAIGNGLRPAWVTFDEDYGQVPAFWFSLDALGLRAVGEVRPNCFCWPTLPHYRSLQQAHAAKRVDNVCRLSPVFRKQGWQRVIIKNTTRGPTVWEVKSARVHMTDTSDYVSRPTDRLYWLIMARNPSSGEIKYFMSNAAGDADLKDILVAAFARWHIEKWFERAKQEAGLGAFEVRTYTSLIRHWLCARIVMYFLAAQTERLRGEKSADHFGASGRGDERPGVENLEPLLALVG